MVFQHFHLLPHQARTYMHHPCHLMPRASFALLLLPFYTLSHRKNRLPNYFVQTWSVLAPLPPLEKTFKNQWFFNIFTYWATKPENICIILAI